MPLDILSIHQFHEDRLIEERCTIVLGGPSTPSRTKKLPNAPKPGIRYIESNKTT